MLLGHCKPSFSYNTFIHSYFRYIKASYNYLDYVKQHLLIQGGCDIVIYGRNIYWCQKQVIFIRQL